VLENLTKHFWVLNIVTLALVAYFVADGATDLLAAELSELVPETTGLAPASAHTSPTDRRWRVMEPVDGTPILRRNIFDSTVGPIDPNAIPPEELSGLELDEDDLPLLDCAEVREVNVDVSSTVVSESNPQWSFAAVAHDRDSYLCRVGDMVDGRVVTHISWRYLFLRGDDDECYVDLLDKPKRKSKRRGRRRLSNKDIKRGIGVVGPMERKVDRAVLDSALANPAKFARSVRVKPYKKRGKVTGFRVRRVKRSSPFYKLGVRKNDIIHSVNGIELTSMDGALEAYQRLRNEDNLVFSLTRKGRHQDLTIHID